MDFYIASPNQVKYKCVSCCLFADYVLVASDSECKDKRAKDLHIGYVAGAGACAKACRESTDLFIYGRNNRCKDGFCSCYCERDTINFRCEIIKNRDFDLYVIIKGRL